MKKLASNVLYSAVTVAIVAAALVAASKALDAEALEECLRIEAETAEFGDRKVPDWCAEVPRS